MSRYCALQTTLPALTAAEQGLIALCNSNNNGNGNGNGNGGGGNSCSSALTSSIFYYDGYGGNWTLQHLLALRLDYLSFTRIHPPLLAFAGRAITPDLSRRVRLPGRLPCSFQLRCDAFVFMGSLLVLC